MLKYYMSVDNKITEISDLEPGCWVSAVSPTETEISELETKLNIDRDYIRSALDEEETSRAESDEGRSLIILDYPIAEKSEKETEIIYNTMTMGIILTESNVITISLNENGIIDDFANGIIKGVNTRFKTRFILSVCLRIAEKYLQYLKQIEKLSNYVENQLRKSMKNKDLMQLLGLQKSLVYFSTSLKSSQTMLEKLLRGRVIKLYEEDQDLLEDVIIEYKQAIEMSNIYSRIISDTTESFASVISNNLNIVMKVLTVITIVLEVPNIVFSFYGMNVSGLPVPHTWFALLIAGVLAAFVAIVINRNKFFK